MANPKGQIRAKPIRDALLIEAALAEKGEESPAPEGSIRFAVRQLINRAAKDNAAFGLLADRLDGKVPQAIVGDDEYDPIRTDAMTDEQRVKALMVLMAKGATKAE